jgi:hypothetical protein
MVSQGRDLWAVTRRSPSIDPGELADAIVRQARESDLDYRTRLLIRDSLDALQHHWGTPKFLQWLSQSPVRSDIESICQGPFEDGEVGFPSLKKRIMEHTTPEQIRDYLETLGRRVRKETRICIAGSCGLILPGLLERGTEDIDVVDEVPQEIRENHALLQDLQKAFGLHLGHVQRHYFPSGWQDRVRSFANYGRLFVYLMDRYDIFLSKLFSSRIKDLADLRLLAPQIDKDILIERFTTTCGSFLKAPGLQEIASGNWHLLYKEPLPSVPSE